MAKKNLYLLTAAIIISLAIGTASFAQSPEASLRKNFPQIPFEKVTPSPITGVYEVITKNGILYYAPEAQLVIAGELFTKDHRSLTQERQAEMIKEKQKDIPLDKALKIGSGAHTVIEFSNPDCSYCRKASAFLVGKADMTRYIFFLPFSPQTEKKVQYILCAADRAKAYEEAMTGKLDNEKFAVCNDKNVLELVKTHRAIAERLGINATPFFFIDGQVVQGANMPVLEKLLGKKK